MRHLTAIFLAASVLAACGGDDAAEPSTSVAASPSSTTVAAATTSMATTTLASETTVASTTAAPSTTSTTAPASSTAAPTTAAPVTTVSCRYIAEIPVGLGVTPDPALSVRIGDCGPGVEQVQQLLQAWGHSVTVDGRFGPVTAGAVRAFQTAMGLTSDGIVGPMTWVALNSDDYDPGEA